MTVTARKILSDLQVAQELLHAEQSAGQFRVLWVAAVALSRAVGHALHKIDAAATPALRVAIDVTYRGWREDPEPNQIYFEFIEDERNAVLKDYEFGFLSGAGAFCGVVLPDAMLETLPDNFFCPMTDGRFSGVDCRDVLELAVAWWQQQLDLIDRRAAV